MRSERVGLGGGGHPLDLGPSVRGGSGKGDDSASLIFPAHNSSPTS
jgi:hypothetical protein